MVRKKTAPKPYAKPDQLRIEGSKIFSPVRDKHVQLTPEERVRQSEWTAMLMGRA